MTRKKVGFRIDLKDEFIDYYNSIKSRNKIDSNVEVFRHTLKVTEEYEMGGSDVSIHPQMRYVLERLLIRPDIQEKFSVFSELDFIKLAVERLIFQINEFTRERSLVHWDVRNALQGEQKEVAIVFKELHLESKDKTVRFDDLLEKLQWSDKMHLKEVMDEFIFQSLITSEKIGNHLIYHAD